MPRTNLLYREILRVNIYMLDAEKTEVTKLTACSAHGNSNTFPGFIIPLGSNNCLIFFIQAMLTALLE